MNTIVWGESHFNTLGLVQSLGKAGHRVTLLTDDIKGNFVCKSKYVKEIHLIQNYNIIDQIVSIIRLQTFKPFLFTCGDTQASFIDSNYETLSEICYLEGGLRNNDINYYRNKSNILRLASEVGFNLPKNWLITINRVLPGDITFPVIVKADNSVRGNKTPQLTCNNAKILDRHLKQLGNEYFPVQVQEFIKKDYEIMIQGCSIGNGRQIIMPIANHKIRHFPTINDAGSYGHTVLVDGDQGLKLQCDLVLKLIKTIGYSGLFSVEFVVSRGKYYFLEVNFRNDGTSFLSTASGCNLPHILCQSTISPISNKDCKYKPVYYMNVIPDFQNIRNGRVNFFKWFAQFLKCNVYYYFSWQDIYPFLGYIKNKIIK